MFKITRCHVQHQESEALRLRAVLHVKFVRKNVPSSRCSVHECSFECHGVRFPSSEHDCLGIAGSSR